MFKKVSKNERNGCKEERKIRIEHEKCKEEKNCVVLLGIVGTHKGISVIVNLIFFLNFEQKGCKETVYRQFKLFIWTNESSIVLMNVLEAKKQPREGQVHIKSTTEKCQPKNIERAYTSIDLIIFKRETPYTVLMFKTRNVCSVCSICWTYSYSLLRIIWSHKP